jgi:hypothetical protein
MAERRHKCPSDMGTSGRALWEREVERAAIDGHLPALRDACRAADRDTPGGLDLAGQQLWADIATRYDLAPRERTVLVAACRQADDIARMEADIMRDGTVVIGAAGQQRLNAAVTEARNGRVALARLLGALALPDAEEQPETEATRRARHAAAVRWANVRQLRERRGRSA